MEVLFQIHAKLMAYVWRVKATPARFFVPLIYVAFATSVAQFLLNKFEGAIDFGIFYFIVTIVSMYWGVVPGLITIVLSIASIFWLWHDANAIPSDAYIDSFIFLLSGVTVSFICESVLGLGLRERLLNAKLKVSEEQHSNILNAISYGVIQIDKNGKFTFLNKMGLSLLGYEDYSELAGKDAHKAIHRPHETFGEGDAVTCLSFLTLQDGITRFSRDDHFYKKDGELFPIEYTTSAVFKDGSISGVVITFRDDTERRKSDELLWKQVNFDSLTGLPNRRLFQDRLNQEILNSSRNGNKFALMFLDLDRFKEVNDTLGHQAGDKLLMEVTQRISKCLRSNDILARLGGDEFTILVSQFENLGDVDTIAQRIIISLQDAIVIHDFELFVTASIGITVYPSDALDSETLLKNADQAMYKTKAKGKNGFSYFTGALQEASNKNLQLGSDLRRALVSDQLSVHYQPIYDIKTGTIIKAEALLRWKHPTIGNIPPDIFIPMAEDLGLIHTLGNWVFLEAIRVAKELETIGFPLQISVNKSPKQFLANTADVSDWVPVYNVAGLSKDSIAVEITEGVLLDSKPYVLEKLTTYRSMGLAISLDDFGTGYSAFSYLRDFPVDYLKIDKSFIQKMLSHSETEKIVKSMIVLGHTLDIQIIAEGVETKEQWDALLALNCDYAQGFLMSKPLPEEQFFEFVLQSRHKPS